MFCCQAVEKKLGASEGRYVVSGLEMGTKYFVTIFAYRGNKKSKVVETIFKTGLYASLSLLPSSVNQRVILWLSLLMHGFMIFCAVECDVTSWILNDANVTFFLVGIQFPFPMDCIQIMKNGNKKSGIYTIYINNNHSKPIEVYCDMNTDGGGWLVCFVAELHSLKIYFK